MIPLFPELRPHLLAVFEEAEPGTEYVITRYRDAASNLRTQLGRIIRKAGLEVWPKPWHNLRSTRQTELAERYPIHVVCQWIGNSRAVAQEHYLQVTDAHFAHAAGDDQSAAQIPAQYPAELSRNGREAVGARIQNRSDLPMDSESYDTLHSPNYPRQDSNTLPVSIENPHISSIGGTNSGTVRVDPPDVAEVAAAWPRLAEPVKLAILALVRTAKGT